jgi:nitrogen fixation NifU-like protein
MNDQLYRQQIIDNYKNPQNAGVLENFDVKQKLLNTSCGDEIEVYLKIKDDTIQDIRFDGRGCAISIASASLVSQEVKGMKLAEILDLKENFIEEILGTKLIGTRIKCGLLGLQAIQEAIKTNILK